MNATTLAKLHSYIDIKYKDNDVNREMHKRINNGDGNLITILTFKMNHP